MRKLAISLVALFASVISVGCGTGVTVETDSPVDVPEQVETDDGRITAE